MIQKESEVETCLKGCIDKDASCMEAGLEKLGFSNDCSKCYGALFNCAFEHCPEVCHDDPLSDECNDCVQATDCVAAFSTCGEN